MRSQLRFCSIAALTLALVACDGGDLSVSTGPRAFSTRGGSGGSQPTVLVGRWQRTIIFNANGDTHSSETTWEFRSDGIAMRTVVARNLSQGFSDVTFSSGTWRANGRTLTITFTSQGTVSFDFSVFGNVLTLNGQDFVRIP